MRPIPASLAGLFVSAIVGPDADGDGAAVEAFNARPAHRRPGEALVDTVEVRVATPADVAAALP